MTSSPVATLRVGIDVGGTNTDAALVDGTTVVASCKRPTTADVLTGVGEALREVIQGVEPARVHSVVIGTTHFINAITQARGLSPVVALRIATTPVPLPPFTDWPAALRDAVCAHVVEIDGGHQYDGTPLFADRPDGVNSDDLRTAIATALDAGHREVVATACFGPVNPAAELLVDEVVNVTWPDARVTLSHELGRIGILERENAALLNASLRPLAADVVEGFVEAVAREGLRVPLFLSQNDGTVMDLDTARRFPILTVASGPTNSMRGAGLESHLSDCVVVDVGGTTTDIGLLRDGYPRESTLAVHLGGVRTDFRMPDVVSLGIGGGSLVVEADDGTVTVGPLSVGYQIHTRARVFGGDELTLTDVAVAAGRVSIGDSDLVSDLDPDLVTRALAFVDNAVAECVDRVKVERGDLPVVVVGGGAGLLAREIPGASTVVRPDNAGVANAIGAALATISGEVDRIFSLADLTRQQALSEARSEAVAAAVAAGAVPETVRVVDEEDIPLAHLPGGTATRIRVRVIGDLPLDLSGPDLSGLDPSGPDLSGADHREADDA